METLLFNFEGPSVDDVKIEQDDQEELTFEMVSLDEKDPSVLLAPHLLQPDATYNGECEPSCSKEEHDNKPAVPICYLDLLKVRDNELCLLAILSSPSEWLNVREICNYIEHFFPERTLRGKEGGWRSVISSTLSSYSNLFGWKEITGKRKMRNAQYTYSVIAHLRDMIKKKNEETNLLSAIRNSMVSFRMRNSISDYSTVPPIDDFSPYYLQNTREIVQERSIFASTEPAGKRDKRKRKLDLQLMQEASGHAPATLATAIIKVDPRPISLGTRESNDIESSDRRSDIKPFQCAFCGISVASQEELNDHRKTDEHRRNYALIKMENED
ncbi:hypothetical protein PRIPAC_82719 [Pristionchus pacificus]|uniref:C2H2-type domain-containing protein n=1 Tax=Pristionchus pacificus TaxID=54126 RepID=A0A2A6BVN7_PRIPA|nr:hypothetical protein PRIPAC_82719 [Pristionchus pacificus]|eukprot:PDM69886.1 hypothetical protein PRIPAC_49098 [Pristionchus pacificus]